MDQAAHHAEQLQVQHDIEDVIEAAQVRPITKDETSLLRWATGTTKETQHE